MTAALVLFAHGSRDPQWAAPFHSVKARIAAVRPELRVELAFLEFMQPTLSDAADSLAASGHRRLVIAPLFMAQGAHLKRDLAVVMDAVRERHPDMKLGLLPAAGEVEAVLDGIADWLIESMRLSTT